MHGAHRPWGPCFEGQGIIFTFMVVLPVHLSTYLFVCWSFSLFSLCLQAVHLSVCPSSASLSVCLPIHLPINPPVLPECLSVCLSSRISICPFISLTMQANNCSICPTLCLHGLPYSSSRSITYSVYHW